MIRQGNPVADPKKVVPEALALLRRPACGMAQIHSIMILGQANHLAAGLGPLFIGTVHLKPRGPRVAELASGMDAKGKGLYVSSIGFPPSGATPESLEIAFGPLRDLSKEQIEALLWHRMGPLPDNWHIGARIKLNVLEGLGRVLAAERAGKPMPRDAGGPPSAYNALPEALASLGWAKPTVASATLAMAFAQGEHVRLFGERMFSDKILCDPSGILMGSVKAMCNVDATGHPASFNAPQRRQLTEGEASQVRRAIAPFAAMGSEGVLALATGPDSPFAGKGETGHVRVDEVVACLDAALGPHMQKPAAEARAPKSAAREGAAKRPPEAPRKPPEVVLVRRRAISIPTKDA